MGKTHQEKSYPDGTCQSRKQFINFAKSKFCLFILSVKRKSIFSRQPKLFPIFQFFCRSIRRRQPKSFLIFQCFYCSNPRPRRKPKSFQIFLFFCHSTSLPRTETFPIFQFFFCSTVLPSTKKFPDLSILLSLN
ncbi:hypothetical protein IC582_024643 [Cucumis melo]